jgi:hypothetical protein
LYGLDYKDLAWILRNCAYPKEVIHEVYHTLDPKGFWRVDKSKEPEMRYTVLSLRAFADLKKTIETFGGDRDKGIEGFCELNDGNGWMLPETITFKQDGEGLIEFDTPDGRTMPVRARIGERFLPWQLEGTPEESWKECEMHARNILGEEGFEEFIKTKEWEGMKQQIGTAPMSRLEKTDNGNKDVKKKNNNQKNLLQF